jgi:hypothetical protein
MTIVRGSSVSISDGTVVEIETDARLSGGASAASLNGCVSRW